MLRQTTAMAVDVQRWYGEFAFHKVYQRVLNFCTVELSAFYFDVIKDRLYIYAPNSPERRAAQTAIWRIGEALVRLLAPVMSFTCEEVWGYLPGKRAQTVHAAQFPGRAEVLGSDNVIDDAKQLEDWSTLLLVRDQVLKALETARNGKLIGKSLEAQVAISAADPVYGVLDRQRQQLRYLFIVSAVALEKTASGNGSGGGAIQVERATGRKCDRCWNYSTHVGEDPVYPTVCERCSAVLKEIETGAAVR
jgi:isoleucyl-tRNA synthetase